MPHASWFGYQETRTWSGPSAWLSHWMTSPNIIRRALTQFQSFDVKYCENWFDFETFLSTWLQIRSSIDAAFFFPQFVQFEADFCTSTELKLRCCCHRCEAGIHLSNRRTRSEEEKATIRFIRHHITQSHVENPMLNGLIWKQSFSWHGDGWWSIGEW